MSELATGRFIAQGENVLLFGAPSVGKTRLAIALGRAVVEAGHSVPFTSATALLAALARAEPDGQLADRLLFCSKPKLLIIDELGYLPSERRSARLFAGAVDAQNAPTAPWESAQTAVSHSVHSPHHHNSREEGSV